MKGFNSPIDLARYGVDTAFDPSACSPHWALTFHSYLLSPVLGALRYIERLRYSGTNNKIDMLPPGALIYCLAWIKTHYWKEKELDQN